MTPDAWYNQYTKCLWSRGVILNNDSKNEKIFKTIMKTHNVDALFVDTTRSRQSSSTFIEDQTVLAKLVDEQIEYVSMYGHDTEHEKYSAICQYVDEIRFTNWGVINDDFEPLEGKHCVGLCLNDNDADCDGTWKSLDCDVNLNFICQVQCKLKCC